MNAETAGRAGTATLKLLNTENIDMFRHPKYYKELRKLRNKLDQAISDEAATAATSVRPDPGLNLLAGSSDPVHGQQPPLESGATSFKHQAPEATSCKHQAP